MISERRTEFINEDIDKLNELKTCRQSTMLSESEDDVAVTNVEY